VRRPHGTGSGSPGYRFAEEALDDAAYLRGTVAMVNSGPGTTGSQFFLVYDDSPLPAQYTPVGLIGAAGLAVLDQVAAAGPGPLGESGGTPPLLPVQILAVDVTPLPRSRSRWPTSPRGHPAVRCRQRGRAR
jgi:peptidyl-prolyl cis-trans isomerase B (cyclophilin B)